MLFLPASNPRAIAKARESAADLVVLDLEDAVKPADKDGGAGCGGRGGGGRLADAGRDPGQRRRHRMAFARRRRRCPIECRLSSCCRGPRRRIWSGQVREAIGKPRAGDDRDRRGVLAAPAIAHEAAALIAGTNDLVRRLRLPPMPGGRRSRRRCRRSSLPRVPPASRLFDGVFNRLDDLDGFAAEAAEGRQLGFDGKSPDPSRPDRALQPRVRPERGGDRARAPAGRRLQRRRRAVRGPDDRAHARRGGAADARAGRPGPEEPMIKRLLRAGATAFHKLLAVGWFFRRPKTLRRACGGAHAGREGWSS